MDFRIHITIAVMHSKLNSNNILFMGSQQYNFPSKDFVTVREVKEEVIDGVCRGQAARRYKGAFWFIS